MILLLEILFWCFAALVVTTYLLYPAVLLMLSWLRPAGGEGQDSPPSHDVTLVVSIHNEEAILAEKLDNCRQLERRGLSFRVLLADDASTDNTAELCRHAAEKEPNLFVWVPSEQRGGKNRTLNLALEQVNAGIVVFSDANAMYDSQAIDHLVKRFANPEVGCVVGELKLVKQGQTLEGAYWKYENAIKRWESALGRMVVANGGIFAARRELLMPLIPGIANDLQTPLAVDRRGRRCVFEPEAFAYERVSDSTSEEFQRKARMATRGLTGLAPMFRRARGWMKIQFLFHKVFRWLTGVFLIGALATNAFLVTEQPYLAMLLLQLVFYSLAGVGWVMEKKGRSAGILGFPWYFLSMQLAGLVATGRWLRGQRMEQWDKPESTRRSI